MQPFVNWKQIKQDPTQIPDLMKKIRGYQNFCDFEPASRADLQLSEQLKRALVKRLWDIIESDSTVQREAKSSEGISHLRPQLFANLVEDMTRETAENLTMMALSKGKLCRVYYGPAGRWI